MKKFPLSLFILLLVSIYALAQERTITGTITDKGDGSPLPGVSVKVKGGSIGTQTDGSGKFSLRVPDGSNTLIFTYIGYTTREITISGNIVNVALSASSEKLGEVVVTALGIQRTRNQMAYAAQQIAGDEVSKNRSASFVSNLSGKVSGLEIKQNNGLGASTNIVLRGVKSITGNNQALFVIDGVPVDNSNINGATTGNRTDNHTNATSQAAGQGGYDYGSPIADINPDDIESINVLKGAAASALYGSRGSNGVILITTKKAKSGWNIVVNSTISVGAVDKKTLPRYQKEYGAGYGQYYGPGEDSYFNEADINGDGILDLITPLSEDASYGAKFDKNLQVYQWDAFDPTSPNYQKSRPWVAAANDASYFFEKPITNNQSIIITHGSDKGSFKLGFTRNDENGILPNANLTKNIVDFGSSYNLTNKITVGANINFYNINGLGRYGTGYDGSQGRNVMTQFRQWYQTNVDYKELKEAYFRSGAKNVTWNWQAKDNLVPIYWDNPYFVRYQNYENDTRNRYVGNIQVNYKPLDWLNVQGRISLDNYSQLQEERQAVTTVGIPYYAKNNTSFNETNYDLLVNLDKDIATNLNLKALLGTNIRKQHSEITSATTNGGLAIPGIYALSNTANALNPPLEFDGKREVDGIFAGATLTWKNMLNLESTIRRDASSTLPKSNNVYYYPSVSAGFTFSELLKNITWLSYGKFRANFAQVGSDANYFSLEDTYRIIPSFGADPQAGVFGTKSNPNLKPERTNSFEAGLEVSLLKTRLGFDLTYYTARTKDQILPVPLSTSTGYLAQYLNTGTVENKGIELSINGTPVQTKDFSWVIAANWTRNRNKVIELFKDASGQEATNLLLQTYQTGVTLNATLGQPFGTLRGSNFVYTNGQKTLEDGLYLTSATSNEVIGNPNPDWLAGINNSFKYQGVSLSFLVDIKRGGDVYSVDQAYGLGTGIYPETAGLNDLGNPSRDPIADGGGIIFPGVNADGTPNTTRVENNEGFVTFGDGTGPNAAYVYDASYVKLREAVLGYSLPKGLIQKLGPIKGVDFSLIGRNLWIIHKKLPYSDPEEGLTAGNLQGIQIGAYPSVRTLSFNIKLQF